MKRYKIPAYLAEPLLLLMPPEKMTVSQFAEKYRILDAKSSARPGPWHNSLTPYLVGIMDAFNSYETEKIVFAKPTQVGGTEVLQNALAYTIAREPEPTMLLYPTDVLAESVSINRLQPMIKASPEVARHFRERASKVLELQFDNMYLTLNGANSPASLASRPIGKLFMDEVDKYPGASKKEADPISLAIERTKTFRRRKIFMTSTPTLRSGPIWQAKEAAAVEKHYFVPCPHCGKYIELKFAQLRWPGKDTVPDITERAELAAYICQECGAAINDGQKLQALAAGRWQTVRGEGRPETSVAFWLSTLYSPFTSFSDIARKWLAAQNDPEELQNFVNSWLAEPWEDTRQATSADIVMERQTDLPAYVVPSWCKLLTAGIDVQENSLYWVIRAWGDYMTSQKIASGQALSFQQVEAQMNLPYKFENGEEKLVDLALIDSGDQTDEVYEFCVGRTDWLLPCKGTQTMLQHYKITTINKVGKAFGMQLVLVDGGKYKDMIAARMHKENGRGSWMVHAGCDREYAEQVTAEQKVSERSGGRVVEKWKPKASHADNHYLDCEVYAAAAADLLGVRSLFLQAEEENPAPKEKPVQTAQPAADDNWLPAMDFDMEGWI